MRKVFEINGNQGQLEEVSADRLPGGGDGGLGDVRAWAGYQRIDSDELEWWLYEIEGGGRWLLEYGCANVPVVILISNPLDVIRIRAQLDTTRLAWLFSGKGPEISDLAERIARHLLDEVL